MEYKYSHRFGYAERRDGGRRFHDQSPDPRYGCAYRHQAMWHTQAFQPYPNPASSRQRS
ncbi:Uncharacterised protein [Vibrio cholerae]|nr:Uncharacterised protein [Vibrio cholerae]